jgi:hypothetical protein
MDVSEVVAAPDIRHYRAEDMRLLEARTPNWGL